MPWEQGFISADMRAITAQCHQQHKQQIDQFLAINRKAVEIQDSIEVEAGTGKAQPLLVAVLFMRVLGHAQAVYMMAVRGMPVQTRVMMRVFMEGIFLLCACAKSEDFADEYLDSDQAQRLRFFKKMKELEKAGDFLPDAVASATPEVRAEIEASIAEVDARELTVRATAEKAGLLPWYLSVYALFSNSVHTNVRDLESHLQTAGDQLQFSNHPDLSQTATNLDSTTDMLLIALETTSAFFGMDCTSFVAEQRSTLHPRLRGEK